MKPTLVFFGFLWGAIAASAVWAAVHFHSAEAPIPAVLVLASCLLCGGAVLSGLLQLLDVLNKIK